MRLNAADSSSLRVGRGRSERVRALSRQPPTVSGSLPRTIQAEPSDTRTLALGTGSYRRQVSLALFAATPFYLSSSSQTHAREFPLCRRDWTDSSGHLDDRLFFSTLALIQLCLTLSTPKTPSSFTLLPVKMLSRNSTRAASVSDVGEGALSYIQATHLHNLS